MNTTILTIMENAKKVTVICIFCVLYLFSISNNLSAQSNDFTIISADKDTVKIKIAAGKALYNVTIVSGTQLFSFSEISNEYGDIKMPSGATALPGSRLPNPEMLKFDSYLFPEGAVVKVFVFDATTDFKPQKIHIIPQKGKSAIEYSVNSK